MRRFLMALFLVGAMVLAACGGSPSTPATTGGSAAGAPTTAADAPTAAADGSGAAEAPTTEADLQATEQAGVVSQPIDGKENITWWTHNNPAFVTANKELIKRFETANPDIHVVYQFFPYDIFINKLQTGYASNTEPDVQQMFGTWVTDYAKKGLLAEMPTPKGEMDSQFWPAALGAYTWEGKVYGIPHEYNLENGGMLVSTKMFKDAGLAYPKTWDEILSAGKQFTKWNGDALEQSGFAFTNNDTITFMFLSFILQQGANYWDKDGVHVNFNTPEAQKAWDFETGLETKEKLTQERAYPTTIDTSDVFFQGKAAMAFRGPWVIGVANENYKDMKYPTNYEYVPVPSFVPGKPPLFAAESGWGEVVSSRSKHKDAAMKFLQFMAQPENASYWNTTTFTIPALKSVASDPNFIKSAPGVQTSLDALQYGQWVGPVQNRDRFWKVIHDHYTAVALGKENAADSPAKMTQEINAMIDEYAGP